MIRSGTLSELRQGAEGLLVDVDGGHEELVARLRADGLEVELAGDTILVTVTSPTTSSGTRSRTSGSGSAGSSRGGARSRTSTSRRAHDRRASTGARIYDVGYRSYDGPRRPPWWAVLTVALHAIQRVLGLRRSFRHKILPALAIVIAFLPPSCRSSSPSCSTRT